MNAIEDVKLYEPKVFKGGEPTREDIAKLKASFPVQNLKIGDVLKFSEVADVIGVSVDSSRFKTVTNEWRRDLAEGHQFVFKCPGDKTFVVPTDEEKVKMAESKQITAVRFTRRSIQIGDMVDRKVLSDAERKRLDANQARNAKIIAVAQIASKFEPPKLEDRT